MIQVRCCVVMACLTLGLSGPSAAQLPQVMPGMTGTLNIPTLDLSKESGSKTPRASAPDGKVFADDPLPWAKLNAAASDVTFKIGQMALGNGVMLTDVTLPVKMGGGKLAANNITATLLGGRITADVTMTAANKRAGLKLTARGVSAERLARQLGYPDGVKKGPLDLSVDVRGTGDTMRQVLASLDGSVLATMGEGRIRNDVLSAMGAEIVVQILGLVGDQSSETVAHCAVANVQIKQGIATTEKGIALSTDKMDAVATGQIDLGQEQVALAVSPRAKAGVAAGLGDLGSSLRVVGPLAKPQAKLDSDGVVNALRNLANGAQAQAAAPAMDVCAAARIWNQKK
ncbi:MAG: AsmA-like C-terminal region-containing protein [Rhodospirillaceae bacterium]|nr:AsmA-like C-terminal region-containing protein [Rhodospirillaceae bacterium]